MLKIKTKSEIFREAWQIARDAALRWGGSARSYLGAALRSIYADLRNVAMRAALHCIGRAQQVAKQNAITDGVYQVMTKLNTHSTTVDQAPEAATGVVAKAVTKVSNIVSKTLGFFRKVFNFNQTQEVALE